MPVDVIPTLPSFPAYELWKREINKRQILLSLPSLFDSFCNNSIGEEPAIPQFEFATNLDSIFESFGPNYPAICIEFITTCKLCCAFNPQTNGMQTFYSFHVHWKPTMAIVIKAKCPTSSDGMFFK